MCLNNPEYVKINDKKYKINSDFRVALECNSIALDNSIEEYEKSLAIIYKLFGDEGLKDYKNHQRLLNLGQKFLNLNNPLENSKEEPNMDFVEDKKYIRSSFIYDYKYNPYDLPYLHWWDFYNDLNGLSNSEFGNCCILNRIRNLRSCDASKIKDSKERQKVIKAQKQVALKKNDSISENEKESLKRLYKLMKGE